MATYTITLVDEWSSECQYHVLAENPVQARTGPKLPEHVAVGDRLVVDGYTFTVSAVQLDPAE